MKWLSHGLAWILLVGLIVLAPALPQRLPSTSEGIASKMYENWAGVLRVWVCSGWQPGNGSLVPWLNNSFAQFERQNPGVYVQAQTVTAQALASFASGNINPPDALIFAPGMLTAPADLLALDGYEQLLAPLQGVGGVYAQPIAMGGYAWAINTRLISGPPVGEIELPKPTKKGDSYYMIQSPADGDFISWSSALLSLLLYVPESDAQDVAPPVGEGIDLGLDVSELEQIDTKIERPIDSGELVLSLPRELPQDFGATDSALNDFRSGCIAAIPVTQLEIKKLEQLADSGRVPDYQILAGIASFSDQLALFAITDCPRSDLTQRQALCAKLLDLLLDEKSQLALSSVRALRVTQGTPIYSGQQGMAVLERGYLTAAFQRPDAFDAGFRAQARQQLESALLTR